MQSDSSETDSEQNQTNIEAGEPQSQHQQLNEQQTAPKVKADQEELQSETLSFNIEEETDEEESEKSHSTSDVEGGDITTIANTDQLKDAQDMDKTQLHDTRQVPEQKLKKFEEGLLASFISQYGIPFKGMKDAFTYYKQYKINNDGKTKLNLPILAKQCDLTSEHCKNLFMNTEAKYLDKWDQKTKDQISERLTELWNQPHVESSKDYKVKIKEQVLEEFKIRQQVAKNYREMKSHIHYKMKQLESKVPQDPKKQENNENDPEPEAKKQNEDKKQTVLNEKLPTLNFKTIQKIDTETVEIIDNKQKIIHSNDWYYVDQVGQIRGPYSTMQMNTWNKYGQLPLDLILQRGSYTIKLQKQNQYLDTFFKDDPNIIKEKTFGKKHTKFSEIQQKQRNSLIQEQYITQPIAAGISIKQHKFDIMPKNSNINETQFSPEDKKSKQNNTKNPIVTQSMLSRDQNNNGQIPNNDYSENQSEAPQSFESLEPFTSVLFENPQVYNSTQNTQTQNDQATTGLLGDGEPTNVSFEHYQFNIMPNQVNNQEEFMAMLLQRLKLRLNQEFNSLEEAIYQISKDNKYDILKQESENVQNYLKEQQYLEQQQQEQNLQESVQIQQQHYFQPNQIKENLFEFKTQSSTLSQEKENRVRDAYRDFFKDQTLTIKQALVQRKKYIFEKNYKVTINQKELGVDEKYIASLECIHLEKLEKDAVKNLRKIITDTFQEQEQLVAKQIQTQNKTKQIVEDQYRNQFQLDFKAIVSRISYELKKLEDEKFKLQNQQ
ncbi:GYF_domain [Hexamita inflata]|uniref:GYF domain n=1 Tax=Hexamita inflata TaxID=28002 RepID=A0AA86N780_9EUKA|nr:GYF domain [Hexamita inflata]